MGQLIHDDEVVFADETLDNSIACHPSSGIDEDVGIPVSG